MVASEEARKKDGEVGHRDQKEGRGIERKRMELRDGRGGGGGRINDCGGR